GGGVGGGVGGGGGGGVGGRGGGGGGWGGGGAVGGEGGAEGVRESLGVGLTFDVMVLLLLADLGNTVAEFAGVAASLEIFGLSRYATVPPAAVFVWWLVVYGSYRRVEKVFLAACLFYLAYVASGVLAAPGWSHVLGASVA